MQTVLTSGRVGVAETLDVAYCDSVLRSLWEENWFDGCRPPERISYRGAVGQPGHLFLRVKVNGDDGGLFRLQEHAPGLWEAHSQLLPNCRGKLAVQAYQAAMQYMFERMGAQRLTSEAPRYQRHAIWMAVTMGFRIDGRQGSVTRAGRAYELTQYSLTRSDYLNKKEFYG